MKICLLPGVGFHNESDPPDLLAKLREEFPKDEIIYYNWKHETVVPDLPFKCNALHKLVRGWLAEVILDFETAVKYADSVNIPDADIYIGHSAGSVIALTRKNKPCIIFGSPAALLKNNIYATVLSCTESNYLMRVLSDARPILNIINENDVLAYPLQHANVENYFYRKKPWMIGAHMDYWSNSNIKDLIVKQIKKWKSNLLLR